MRPFKLSAREALEADLTLLRTEHAVTIELDELIDLVRDPEVDPLAPRRSPAQLAIDDLADTLGAARRLPHDLTVRVVLLERACPEPPVAEVEAAFHRRAAYQATVAWREGMAQRAMGLSQMPLGLTLATVSWVAAYVFGYLATELDGVIVGLLAVSAMLSITIAWVVSWMVVESTMLDWRPGARRAAAYDLLARARLEVTSPTVR